METLVTRESTEAATCAQEPCTKTTDLPELNDSYATPVRGNRELEAVSVAHVEAPDGTPVEIRGEFDVVVRLDTGTELEFTHPVRARLDPSGTVLIVAGGKEPERGIHLDRIKSVEVSQLDEVGASVAGAVVGGGIFVLVMVVSR